MTQDILSQTIDAYIQFIEFCCQDLTPEQIRRQQELKLRESISVRFRI